MKILITLFIFLVAFGYIAGLYRIFQKAEIKGWKAFIPIYNIVIILKIIGKPRWFVVFLIIPIISNLVIPYTLIQLYRRFGISSFWKILLGILFSFVYIPIVGFSSQYNFSGQSQTKYDFKSDIKLWGYAAILALFSVMYIKSLNVFFFQNYKIPTSAMENNILIGDHIFVDKITVGPRLPITPLSLPFYHNTIPYLGSPSFISSIQLPYFRLSRQPNIKNNDIVVFNFPEGDTVCVEHQAVSYYSIVRDRAYELMRYDAYLRINESMALARTDVRENFTIIYRPIDRRDSYVKRCIGIPGDSLVIIDSDVYINSTKVEIPNTKYNYNVNTFGKNLNNRFWKNHGVYPTDVYPMSDTSYMVILSNKQVNNLKSLRFKVNIEKYNFGNTGILPTRNIFPHEYDIDWSVDNLGPIYIPRKGDKVKLNKLNLSLYQTIISRYENNELEINGSSILINGQIAEDYTFKMNYYWMMGDNRHNSSDSRYWGFVPENHIIGKASFIWWSMSRDRDIRWDRIYMKIQ